MALQRMFLQLLIVGLALVSISYRAQGARRGLLQAAAAAPSTTVFDVTQTAAPTYDPAEGEDPEGEPAGCKGDGETKCTQVFMQTFIKACQAPGPATMRIPPGRFLIGEVFFRGPCKNLVTVDIQGELLATTDISDYANGQWITVEKIDRILITGNGTINGQGEKSWQPDNCQGKAICKSLLPPSLVFAQANNSVMQNVKMINSKGFHMKINDLVNFTVRNVNIKAPWDSPNTDGIHVSGSDGVIIKDSIIGTGDDCISIGEGSSNVNVSNIFCGPGHGISVGSLGYRETDKDVMHVTVTNCTLTNTTNGARIKTWHESPVLKAQSITFNDLVFNMVKNPIIIDQHYGAKGKKGESNVKISDIHFRNIRGTTISNNAVSLRCSAAVPCEGIEVADVNLQLVGGKDLPFGSVCEHAQTTFLGKISPLRCGASV